jgi:hypothetical protein
VQASQGSLDSPNDVCVLNASITASMAAALVAPITEIPYNESDATQTAPIWATSTKNWLRLLIYCGKRLRGESN